MPLSTTPLEPRLIEPLPGALIRDFKRCGRPNCKCAQGELHGPYFVRVWSEQGRRRKQYIKAGDVARVAAGIELFEKERHIASMRAHMARRIGWRQRALMAVTVAQVEREADALRTLSV